MGTKTRWGVKTWWNSKGKNQTRQCAIPWDLEPSPILKLLTHHVIKLIMIAYSLILTTILGNIHYYFYFVNEQKFSKKVSKSFRNK